MVMSFKQKKIEFEPRMKFNQKICVTGLSLSYCPRKDVKVHMSSSKVYFTLFFIFFKVAQQTFC